MPPAPRGRGIPQLAWHARGQGMRRRRPRKSAAGGRSRGTATRARAGAEPCAVPLTGKARGACGAEQQRRTTRPVWDPDPGVFLSYTPKVVDKVGWLRRGGCVFRRAAVVRAGDHSGAVAERQPPTDDRGHTGRTQTAADPSPMQQRHRAAVYLSATHDAYAQTRSDPSVGHTRSLISPLLAFSISANGCCVPCLRVLDQAPTMPVI